MNFDKKKQFWFEENEFENGSQHLKKYFVEKLNVISFIC